MRKRIFNKLVKDIAAKQYPRQFWFMFWGMLFSITGSSMIWPFLIIYVSGKLDMPLTAIAGLMTIRSITTLIASFLIGPFADKVGRKGVMIVGLVMQGLGYVAFIFADTYPVFLLIMIMQGVFQPFYRIGADAMIADLIPPKQRVDAYALMRMINNVGIAVGPAIGGFIAVISYDIVFYIAASSLVLYGFLVLAFIKETLPQEAQAEHAARSAVPLSISSRLKNLGGYRQVFQDKLFMSFISLLTLSMMGSVLMFILLPVYAKTNFGIPETRISWIITTNAVMVVSLQYAITLITKRFRPLAVMTVGALFYALGVGSVALGSNIWAFLASMVVVTLGELMLMPTASTLTANLSPIESRGKYMSIFGLTWGISSGLGPILGGFLNDNIAPAAMWIGGLICGLIGTLGFFFLVKRFPAVTGEIEDPETATQKEAEMAGV